MRAFAHPASSTGHTSKTQHTLSFGGCVSLQRIIVRFEEITECVKNQTVVNVLCVLFTLLKKQRLEMPSVYVLM